MEVHVSLREVSQFIHRISNNKNSPSVTSIHDEIVLEYTVNGLRHEVKDLESQKEILKNDVIDLRAQNTITVYCNPMLSNTLD